ncbi:cobalt ECF transporter T component CbiQ [Nocardioides marmoraquaticus]
MARFQLDDAAWASRWRHRPVVEKAVLSLGLLAVGLTSAGPLVSVLVLVAAAGVAVGPAGVGARTYLRALLAPAVFVAVGLVGIVVTFDATAPWSWGPLGVSPASLRLAAEVGARSLACAAAVMLLATTTPMSDLLQASRAAGVPAVLVEVGGLVYRMVFSLLDAQAEMREAQAARLGYADRRTALRSLGSLAAATFARAWTTASQLEEGLAGRGYTGVLPHLPRERQASVTFVGLSLVLLGCLAGASVAVHLS